MSVGGSVRQTATAKINGFLHHENHRGGPNLTLLNVLNELNGLNVLNMLGLVIDF